MKNNQNLIGKTYTEPSYNSTGWQSVCKIVSEPFEDVGAQEMRVKAEVTFKGKKIELHIYYPRLNSIKHLLTIIFLVLSLSLQAQTAVKMDAKGNYTAIAKTSGKGTSKATATGKFFVDKSGNKFAVMQSAKGKLFYTRTSKNGKTYNCYISVK